MNITRQLLPRRKDAEAARDALQSWLQWSKEFSGDLSVSAPILVYRGSATRRRYIRLSLHFYEGADEGICSATAHWFSWRRWMSTVAVVAISGFFYYNSYF